MAVVKNKVRVEISEETAEKLRALNLKSLDQAVEMMLTKAFEISERQSEQTNAVRIDLDNRKAQHWFGYLSQGKEEEYKADLIPLYLTERQLVDMAIEQSEVSLEVLAKEGLLSRCKEVITTTARRRHYYDKTPSGSTYKRLDTAFAQLCEEINNGTYVPMKGRLTLSVVANRARVNYNTAKRWAMSYRPELLEELENA